MTNGVRCANGDTHDSRLLLSVPILSRETLGAQPAGRLVLASDATFLAP